MKTENGVQPQAVVCRSDKKDSLTMEADLAWKGELKKTKSLN